MTPPIRRGDGTPLAPSGIAQVRSGDGDVYYERNVIPDSVVDRGPDENSNSATNNLGPVFETSQSWPEIQGELAENTDPASDSELVLADSNDTQIEAVDISNNSAGDVITFQNANLNANETYYMYSRQSNSYTYGWNDSSPPYTSDDGNLEITGGYNDGTTSSTNDAWVVRRIGNINL